MNGNDNVLATSCLHLKALIDAGVPLGQINAFAVTDMSYLFDEVQR